MNQSLDFQRLYKSALRIRLIESRIAERYSEGLMRCPVHLSIGQEIPSAIFEQVFSFGDTAVSTHRAHAHYLAMGGSLPRMIAEIYGRATGCSKGRGGSMHLIDREKGFLGSSAIVGNSIPVGVGVGYGMKLNNAKTVSFVFLGDGATEEGSFFESANFAVIHKLPIVFVLENNLYSVYTNLISRQPAGRSLAQLGAQIGLRTDSARDEDFEDLHTKFAGLVEYARNGSGPALIEISTYRKLEHCGPNDDDILGYRPSEELVRYKNVDLIEVLTEKFGVTPAKQEAIYSEITSEIDAAFAFASSSPFPTYSESIEGVYAN